MTALSATAARRVFLLLTATRWFPVGLVIGVTSLLPLQRGMSLSQVGLIWSAQGFVLLALELPTGGLADALGRRPVLLMAGVVNVASAVVFALAETFWMFLVSVLLQGVFRALDSGPLEAWYVDTAHADDPDVPVERALSAHGTVLGLSIAAGALISGGLILWHPVDSITALETPLVPWIVLAVLDVVAVAIWMREPRTHLDTTGLRRAWRSARQAPAVVREGVWLLGTNRVLLALVAVEVFWAVGAVAYESLLPVRLGEVLGSKDEAGALIGPIAAVGWGLFAVGAWGAGPLSRWMGVARAAMLARVGQGLTIVVMGLLAGPVGLLAAYLATYTLHGTCGPVHNTLLHREAEPRNRATVLSMNSMAGGISHSIGIILLTRLADGTATSTAIVVAGAVSIIGAVCYLPARRRERRESVEAVQLVA